MLSLQNFRFIQNINRLSYSELTQFLNIAKMERPRLLNISVLLAILLCIPSIAALDGGNCTVDARCPRFDVGDSPSLMPHPDCRKFYKCASGKSCEYFCPANLHFNPVERVCDWPNRACCSPEVQCNPQDSATRPLIYLDGEAYLLDHMGNLLSVWNSTGIQQQEDHSSRLTDSQNIENPAIVEQLEEEDDHSSRLENSPNIGDSFYTEQQLDGEANHSNLQENPNDNEDMTLIEQQQNAGESEVGARDYITNFLSDTPSRPGCIKDIRCPASEDPANPTLLKHTADCTKFFMCSGGSACVVDCPQGLHFNSKLGHCDYPEVACCDESKPCTRSIGSQFSLENCHTDARCSTYGENPMNPTHLQHTDCNRFYKCSNGMACEIPCPTGQHFSVALNRCEYPSVACCDKSIACLSSFMESVNNPSTGVVPFVPPSLEWDQLTESNRISRCRKDTRCPEKDALPIKLLRHTDCSMFFR